MADAEPSIFNKKATEKLRSPDDLDKYVRVTNPSVWVVLAAFVVLLAGLLVWGVFGTVSTTVSTMGVCTEGSVVCFLPGQKASAVHVGDTANVEGERVKVSSISAVPVSRDEAKGIVNSDYLVVSLVEGDWAYVVHFEDGNTAALDEGVPINITITTEHIPPISLIFGGQG